MQAFAISFGVIFVAELGDKSQLMALAFATRFPAWRVLIGITIATAITHAASVAVGSLAANHLPTDAITIVAGLAFLGFAGVDAAGRHPGRGRRDGGGRGGTARARWRRSPPSGPRSCSPSWATRPCSRPSRSPPGRACFGTWLGSTLGMVAADALAIVVGQQLGARLPERVVRIGAATLFVVFGLALLVEGAIA